MASRRSPPLSALFATSLPLLLLAYASTQTIAAATPSIAKLTERDVAAVRRLLEDEIRAQPGRDEDGQPYLPLVAGFVRLAFHSCLGDRCGGCVNPKERIGNNGLKLAVAAAESVLARTDVSISRGDLWALAAVVASDVALRNAAAKRGGGGSASSASTPKRLSVRFRYGRADCDTAPHNSASVEFPNPHAGADEQLAYMRSRFGLSPRLAVAALGSHGLGVTRRVGELTPFANWVSCADCLDNTFFRDILDRGRLWTQTPLQLDPSSDGGEPVFVWREGDKPPQRRIKFNCDIGLVKNLSGVAAESGLSACNYDSCPASSTAEWVRGYAGDNDLFVRDFVEAMSAIMEKGYAIGELVEPEPSPVDSVGGGGGGDTDYKASSSHNKSSGNGNDNGRSSNGGRGGDSGGGRPAPAPAPAAASGWG